MYRVFDRYEHNNLSREGRTLYLAGGGSKYRRGDPKEPPERPDWRKLSWPCIVAGSVYSISDVLYSMMYSKDRQISGHVAYPASKLNITNDKPFFLFG